LIIDPGSPVVKVRTQKGEDTVRQVTTRPLTPDQLFLKKRCANASSLPTVAFASGHVGAGLAKIEAGMPVATERTYRQRFASARLSEEPSLPAAPS
jgi:hypothetical protein